MIIEGNWHTRIVYIDNKKLQPYISQKIRNHSPDGFSWGYGGCLKAFEKNKAIRIYQDFKWDIISKLPQTDFSIKIDMDLWLIQRENQNSIIDNQKGYLGYDAAEIFVSVIVWAWVIFGLLKLFKILL